MIKIIHYNIHDFLCAPIDPTRALFFFNQPVKTFFSLLLKGVHEPLHWDGHSEDPLLNKDDALGYIIDAWEQLNIVEENVGVYGTGTYVGTEYASTIDYATRKLDYYCSVFLMMLQPPPNHYFLVEDLHVEGTLLVIQVKLHKN